MANRPLWTNKYKDNWDEAYQRVMAWWNGGSLGRPVIFSGVPKENPKTVAPVSVLTSEEFKERDLSEEFHLGMERSFLEGFYFPAESVPYVRVNYASLLGLLGAMAGAPINYTADTGTAWIGEVPDIYSRPLPKFSPDCPPYKFIIHMIHRHAETFGYDVILGANPMLDPLTTLSMMRGPGNLCVDLIERPLAVKEWISALGDLFMAAVQGYRSARAMHGRREDINWCGAWAPGDMDALQCDFSTMLSPEMFREFVLPELEREAEFMDYAIWHLDGTTEFRHLDAICSVPKIRVIQWIDEKRLVRSPENFIDVWKRIRSTGRSLLFSSVTVDQAMELTRQLGPDGLAFTFVDITTMKDFDDAVNLIAGKSFPSGKGLEVIFSLMIQFQYSVAHKMSEDGAVYNFGKNVRAGF